MSLSAEQELLKRIFPHLEYPQEEELPKFPKELRLHWCKNHQDYFVGEKCLICNYEYHYNYGRTHLDQQRLNNRNRAAALRNAEGQFTLEEWNAKLEEYHWRCAYCGCELDSNSVTIDHQQPISRGGTNYIENLVPACKSCNSKKHNKTSGEYLMGLQEVA